MAFTWQDIKDMDVPHPNRFLIDGVQKTIVPDFGTPTEPGTPVNKALLQRYEDAIKRLVPAGSVGLFMQDSIPEGYIYANGAYLSKSLYSELFETIGAKYAKALAMTNDYASVGRIQTLNGFTYAIKSNTLYKIFFNSDGTIQPLANSTVITLPTYMSGMSGATGYARVAVGSRVYFIGGYYNGSYPAVISVNTVQSSLINSVANTAGSLVSLQSLPSARGGGETFYHNGRIYYMCGRLNGDAMNATGTNTVYYCTVNGDGTLSTWTTSASTGLTARIGSFSPIVIGNRVYVFGGMTSISAGTVATTTSVQYATINADGSLSNWSSVTALPSSGSTSYSHVYNGKLYLYYFINGGSNIVYVTDISGNDIGSWTSYSLGKNIEFLYQDRAFIFATSGSFGVNLGGLDFTSGAWVTLKECESDDVFPLPDLRQTTLKFANSQIASIVDGIVWSTGVPGKIYTPVPCVKYVGG